jgi:HlyD family secretion protein
LNENLVDSVVREEQSMNFLQSLGRWRKPILWLLAAFGLFLLLKFTLWAPLTVSAVTVTKRDLAAQVYGNGTVEAKVVVAVSSKVTGRIEALYADEGDKVKAGQVLAKLEDADFHQQVLQAQAGLKKSEATLAAESANQQKAVAALELADKNYKRISGLADRKLISQQELDVQATALEVAKKEVERSNAAVEAANRDRLASQANLAFMESRNNDMVVKTPQDGIIISRDLEQGATVAPGSPIFRIADPTVVWVGANVDESQREKLAEGQDATIVLRSIPKEKLHGRVARVGLESDRVTEEIEVDVVFEPPLANFRLGEQAEAYVITGTKHDAPALPSAAVTSKGAQRAVWAVVDGKLRRKEIVTGIEDRAGFVEVLSGIDDQMLVAVAPPGDMINFKDGMSVKVKQ